MRKLLALPLMASLVLAMAAPVSATPPATKVIVLPGARSAEGVAAGEGSTFFVGDLFHGDIYKGDIHRGTAELFVDAPEGTEAAGMRVDRRHDLLFVAGGKGKAYVYSTRTGARVATYDVGDPASTQVNGVTITPTGAWFTDSLQPRLYFVPIVHGMPGRLRTLPLSGPAAGAPGAFHLNDIASTPSGRTLLVDASLVGQLYKVDPRTGRSRLVEEVEIPTADGLVLEGRRLWVVQANNKITRWRLNGDLTRGRADGEITDPAFRVPLTAAKFGDRLAVVNSHLDTGFPPTHPTYEVLVVRA